MSKPVYVELCAGTASVALWALARLRPLTGYMGSKRQDAGVLTWMLGLGEGVSEVVLVDAGPWGDVWLTLSSDTLRRGVVRELYRLSLEGHLDKVWPTLLHAPSLEPERRAAQYLCLQARAASCIPVWWSDENERWESPTGSRTEEAHQRGGISIRKRMTSSRSLGRAMNTSRGLVRISTLAERVEALNSVDWGRVTALQCDVRSVSAIPNAVVYFDPPYANSPRYAELLPRENVLEVAQSHAEVCGQVCVSEAEPLPLDGWIHQKLRHRGKPEWLTMLREPEWTQPEQMDMFQVREGETP